MFERLTFSRRHDPSSIPTTEGGLFWTERSAKRSQGNQPVKTPKSQLDYESSYQNHHSLPTPNRASSLCLGIMPIDTLSIIETTDFFDVQGTTLHGLTRHHDFPPEGRCTQRQSTLYPKEPTDLSQARTYSHAIKDKYTNLLNHRGLEIQFQITFFRTKLENDWQYFIGLPQSKATRLPCYSL